MLEAGSTASQFTTLEGWRESTRAVLQPPAWFMLSTSQVWYRTKYLRSEHWENLRIEKLAREDAKCRLCRKRDLSNDVHHICYRNLYDVKLHDLVVLCRDCHNTVHDILKECQHIKSNRTSQKRWHKTLVQIRKREKIKQDQETSRLVKCGKHAFKVMRESLFKRGILSSLDQLRIPDNRTIHDRKVFRNVFLMGWFDELDFRHLVWKHKLIPLEFREIDRIREWLESTWPHKVSFN